MKNPQYKSGLIATFYFGQLWCFISKVSKTISYLTHIKRFPSHKITFLYVCIKIFSRILYLLHYQRRAQRNSRLLDIWYIKSKSDLSFVEELQLKCRNIPITWVAWPSVLGWGEEQVKCNWFHHPNDGSFGNMFPDTQHTVTVGWW